MVRNPCGSGIFHHYGDPLSDRVLRIIGGMDVMSQSQKVLVAGTGISGIAAAKLLLDMGGEVVLI